MLQLLLIDKFIRPVTAELFYFRFLVASVCIAVGDTFFPHPPFLTLCRAFISRGLRPCRPRRIPRFSGRQQCCFVLHTRYYAKLWLCCDIFSGSSTGVNELRLTTMTTFRFEVARVTMLNYTISTRISQYIDLLTKYIICSENGKISFRYTRYPFDVSIHQTAITLPADAPRRASARPLPGSPAAFRS